MICKCHLQSFFFSLRGKLKNDFLVVLVKYEISLLSRIETPTCSTGMCAARAVESKRSEIESSSVLG